MPRVRSKHPRAVYLLGRKFSHDVGQTLTDSEFAAFRATKAGELALETGVLELVGDDGKGVPYAPLAPPVPVPVVVKK